MNPCRTAFVGLLLVSCVLADVSHLYNVGDMASSLPSGAPFWWMSDKSPFKRAILGCNGPNGCAAQSNQVTFVGSLQQPAGFSAPQQLDAGYELNPFLNAGSKHGSINMYLPPRDPETVSCSGNNACVTRQQCASGFILSNAVSQSALNRPCLVEAEVCCRVQIPAPVVTTPRPTPKPTTAVPSIPCNQPNFFCVPAQSCNNGVILGQMTRLQASPRCFGSDVCCRYQEPVTAPSVTTPVYLPPVTTTYRPPTTRYIPPVTTTYRPPTTTARYVPPSTTFRGPDYIPPREGQSSNDNVNIIRGGEEDKPLQIVPQACPAAMVCTEVDYCTAVGVISKTLVTLTPQQRLYRVPLTDCRLPTDASRKTEGNSIGKCCRDPDYVDPWPATSLGQYNAEIIGAAFDDGSYKPNGKKRVTTVSQKVVQQQQPIVPQGSSGIRVAQAVPQVPQGSNNIRVAETVPQVPAQGIRVTQTQFPQQQVTVQQSQFPQQVRDQIVQSTFTQQTNNNVRVPELVGSASGSCGLRYDNAVPRGAGQYDTGFGEYTWQAMVLMQSNRSLLCGGAIIDANTIVTSASCVRGVNPSDLKIKVGEWKLGVDDEPKPFQITGVRSVTVHPAFNADNFQNDMALLHCDERIRFDKHVGPICLEDQVTSASSDDCVTTGWGKEVLRIHLKGAIMKQVPMQEVSESECSAALSGYGYSAQGSSCYRTKGGDACLADVGSALACRMPTGNYVLRGIYSTETECNNPSQLVTFAKMDITWIRQSLNKPLTRGQGFQHQQTQTQTVHSFGAPQQPQLHQQNQQQHNQVVQTFQTQPQVQHQQVIESFQTKPQVHVHTETFQTKPQGHVQTFQTQPQVQHQQQHHQVIESFQTKPQVHVQTFQTQPQVQHQQVIETFQTKPQVHVHTETFQTKPQLHVQTFQSQPQVHVQTQTSQTFQTQPQVSLVNPHFAGQASQNVFSHDQVVGAPSAVNQYSVPSQAPQYLPPL